MTIDYAYEHKLTEAKHCKLKMMKIIKNDYLIYFACIYKLINALEFINIQKYLHVFMNEASSPFRYKVIVCEICMRYTYMYENMYLHCLYKNCPHFSLFLVDDTMFIGDNIDP